MKIESENIAISKRGTLKSRTMRYRFGFNGKENDNEVKGTGNQLDFGARIYDPRLGKWLSVDPLAGKYPSLSPYAFVDNNPIIYIDPDGKRIQIVGEAKYVTKTFTQLQNLTSRQLVLLKDGTVMEAHKLNDLQKTMVVQTGTVNKNNSIMKIDKPLGSELVQKAIENKNTIKIQETNYYNNEDATVYNDLENSSNGKGTGSNIFHDPSDDGTQSEPKIKNEDGSTGRSPIINLAHELKHALNGALGKRAKGANSGYGDPDNVKKNGKTIELGNEEVNTRKFEQGISVEQNEPVRATPKKVE